MTGFGPRPTRCTRAAGSGGPRRAPRRWRVLLAGAAVLAAAAAAPVGCVQPQPVRHVVLMVHGYGGSPGELDTMARRLERAGYVTVRVALPEHGLADIRKSEAAVVSAVSTLPRSAQVDAIGYSLGGIVLRLWLQDRGFQLQHLIMLATPNGGVRVTAGPATFPETTCRPSNACGQLQPGSGLLRQLLPTPPHVRYPPVVLASTTDGLVSPTSAFALPGAAHLLLQNVCPDARVGHGDFRSDSLVLGVVLQVLSGRPPAQITQHECANLRRLGKA